MRSASPLTKLPPPLSRAHVASHVVSTYLHMQVKQLAVHWVLYMFVIPYSHVPGHVNVMLLQKAPILHKNCPSLT